MGEQPKPITQLAAPIDRTGPRRPNPRGYLALSSAVATGVMLGFVLLAVHLGFPVSALLLAPPGGIGLMLIVYALVMAIRALMDAADRHLARWGALLALGIVGALCAAMALTILRPLLRVL
jgi:hypothetical protein